MDCGLITISYRGSYAKQPQRTGTRGCEPSDRDLMALDEEVWRSNLGRGSEIGWPQAVGGAGCGAGSAGGEPSGGGLPEFGQNVTWRPF